MDARHSIIVKTTGIMRGDDDDDDDNDFGEYETLQNFSDYSTR